MLSASFPGQAQWANQVAYGGTSTGYLPNSSGQLPTMVAPFPAPVSAQVSVPSAYNPTSIPQMAAMQESVGPAMVTATNAAQVALNITAAAQSSAAGVAAQQQYALRQQAMPAPPAPARMFEGALGAFTTPSTLAMLVAAAAGIGLVIYLTRK